MKKRIALVLVASMLLSSISFTNVFAAEETNYNYGLATPSDATPSEEEVQIATPSEPTYQFEAPYGTELSDDYVASWYCDEYEYDYTYSLSVKIKSSVKTKLVETKTSFEEDDLAELVATVVDIEKMAGYACKVSFRVKAVSADHTEALDSDYSEWSNEVLFETDRAVLDVPSNLRWNGETAEWDSVEHASQYFVSFIISNDDGVYEDFSAYPYSNSVNIRTLFESACRERGLSIGTYNVKFRVKALGGNTGASAAYVSSALSDYSENTSVEYGIIVTKLATPEVTFEGMIASWNAIENAYEYAVSIDTADSNGTIFNTGMVITQNTSIDLTQSVEEILNQQNRSEALVRIKVQARCRFDDTQYSSSNYSEYTEFVEYKSEVEVTKLATPENLYWNGGYNISWNAIDNAYEYQINYSIDGDDSWVLASRDRYINLEGGLKEASTFKQLPAGTYEIRFRVKAIALYSDIEHTHSEYSDWSSTALFTIASEIKNNAKEETKIEEKNEANVQPIVEEETVVVDTKPSTPKSGIEVPVDEADPVQPVIEEAPAVVVRPSSNGGGSSSGGSSGSGSGSSGGGSVGTKSTTLLPEYVETTGTWNATTDGSWTYSNNGVEYKDKWAAIKVGDTFAWYFFDVNGKMLTGWFTDKDGSVYYLDPSIVNHGKMVTGKVIIDGIEYNFDASGRLMKEVG